jgi:hypothetical protein
MPARVLALAAQVPLYNHGVKRWLVRFVLFFIAYWSLAPFALFWFNRTWHLIESIVFGVIASSIRWRVLRRLKGRARA